MYKLALVALVAPLFASGAANALNPQPLPPKAMASSFINPGVKALNPQPLPPPPPRGSAPVL